MCRKCSRDVESFLLGRAHISISTVHLQKRSDSRKRFKNFPPPSTVIRTTPLPQQRNTFINRGPKRFKENGCQSCIREIRRGWLLCYAYKFLRTCWNWRFGKLLQVRTSTFPFKAYTL